MTLAGRSPAGSFRRSSPPRPGGHARARLPPRSASSDEAASRRAVRRWPVAGEPSARRWAATVRACRQGATGRAGRDVATVAVRCAARSLARGPVHRPLASRGARLPPRSASSTEAAPRRAAHRLSAAGEPSARWWAATVRACRQGATDRAGRDVATGAVRCAARSLGRAPVHRRPAPRGARLPPRSAPSAEAAPRRPVCALPVPRSTPVRRWVVDAWTGRPRATVFGGHGRRAEGRLARRSAPPSHRQGAPPRPPPGRGPARPAPRAEAVAATAGGAPGAARGPPARRWVRRGPAGARGIAMARKRPHEEAVIRRSPPAFARWRPSPRSPAGCRPAGCRRRREKGGSSRRRR